MVNLCNNAIEGLIEIVVESGQTTQSEQAQLNEKSDEITENDPSEIKPKPESTDDCTKEDGEEKDKSKYPKHDKTKENDIANTKKDYSILYVGDGNGDGDVFNRMCLKKFDSQSYIGPKRIRGGGWGEGRSYVPTDGIPLEYDPQSRNSFVKRVLFIAFLMMGVTAAFTAIVYTNDGLKKFFTTNALFLSIGSGIILLALHYAIACTNCARQLPCSIFVLILVTAMMSVFVAVVTVRYKTNIILFAFITTAVVVFCCFLLAFSKFDFTSFMLYIYGVAMVFGIVAMVICIAMIVFHIKMTELMIAILVVSAVIQTVVLIMELQFILGGKAVELGENEYAFGAYLLYTSIVELFITILQIIGLTSDF